MSSIKPWLEGVIKVYSTYISLEFARKWPVNSVHSLLLPFVEDWVDLQVFEENSRQKEMLMSDLRGLRVCFVLGEIEVDRQSNQLEERHEAV